MDKILVISNTSFSIEKFRTHYLKNILNKYNVLISTPQSKPANIGKIKFKSFKSNNIIFEFFKILKIIRDFNPKTIIVYSYKYQFIISIINILFKKEIVSLIAGKGSLFLKKNISVIIFRYIILKLIFVKSNKLIFINPTDKKFFTQVFSIKKKTYLIPTEGINYKNNKLIKNRKKTFLFFGRLIYEKGIYDYIKLAKEIKNKYPNKIFLIAGPSAQSTIGQTKFNKNILNIMSNNNCVKYIGYIKNYKKIFPKIDCLISPSHTEGAGTSVMEAMSSGLYIVAYTNNGHKYVLKNTKNYLCKKKSVSSLVLGVEKFLKMDPKKLNIIAKASRKRVMKTFSSKIISDKIIEILKD